MWTVWPLLLGFAHLDFPGLYIGIYAQAITPEKGQQQMNMNPVGKDKSRLPSTQQQNLGPQATQYCLLLSEMDITGEEVTAKCGFLATCHHGFSPCILPTQVIQKIQLHGKVACRLYCVARDGIMSSV